MGLWSELFRISSKKMMMMNPNWRIFLVVGFLGGYTTFSSFAWETYVNARDGSPWIGLLNVTASVVVGYLAVWLGAIAVGRR